MAPLLIVLAAFEAQVWAVSVTLGCAALNIALDFLLIPAHGAPGAALANGIAQSAAVFRRGVRGTAGRLLYWITPSEA